MRTHFKIGARGSLLSVTQSELIIRELEEKTPYTFEIIKIKTQGDQIVDKPLWQLDGKDFFTKELDQALLEGKVDLVIHSYKDLGSERPEGIKLGAITQRQFAHDILLVRKQALHENFEQFIVGTSSPRRIVNIESSLADFLPIPSSIPVKCKTLRGNVNTRIERLKSGEYHGIVLAMAGLERLASHPESHKNLEKLLEDLHLCILPQSEFPSAAAQGALGIEYCPKNSPELGEILKNVHCSESAQLIKIERDRFQEFGGGCHLAVGIHCENTYEGPLVIEKGLSPSQNQVSETRLVHFDQTKWDPLRNASEVFLGIPQKKLPKNLRAFGDELIRKEIIAHQVSSPKHLILTSTYCLESLGKEQALSLWTSGLHTWKKAVQKGYWISGSSYGLGLDKVKSFSKSALLKIYFKQEIEWQILTAQGVKYEEETFPSYKRIVLEPSESYTRKLKNCDVFYWTSFFQYKTFTEKFPFIKQSQHFCGLGKTYQQFKENNIKVCPVINMKTLIHLVRK